MQLSDEELNGVVTLIAPLRDFTKFGARMHSQHIKALLLVANQEGKIENERLARRQLPGKVRANMAMRSASI